MESNLRAEMGSTGVHFRRLNIQDGRSVSKFAEVIAKKHGQLDILVNNASVYYKVLTLPKYSMYYSSIIMY